jgi:hypothetical protein
VQLDFHQRASVNGILHRELRQACKGLENPHGFREFIDLPGLASRQIRGFQAAGVVFALGFASRIGGRRMSVKGGLGKPVQADPQPDTDFFKQGGFHQRQAMMHGLRAMARFASGSPPEVQAPHHAVAEVVPSGFRRRR